MLVLRSAGIEAKDAGGGMVVPQWADGAAKEKQGTIIARDGSVET